VGRITVLACYDRISIFHTFKPFLFSRHRTLFDFSQSTDYCLKKDKHRVLILERFFLKPDRVDKELIKKLRDKYETILFFNGNAGGGIPRLEVLPYVDYFFNKALFKNKSLYGRRFYGGELYSDYYHNKYGVNDPDHRDHAVTNDSDQLNKLRLSWNIGIGDYPREKMRQRAGVLAARLLGPSWAKAFFAPVRISKQLPENRGLFPVHARIDLSSRPSIAWQRKMILEKIGGRTEFLTGGVAQRRFNREINDSKITLSPFGWGEVCLRDFEAVLSGSLLLKPDMSHLETWPDIFIPYETYVPFDWDCTDLVEKSNYYLQNEKERMRIIRNAFDAYVSQARTIDDRLESILGLIKS
jgi:hypothetical protein